MGDSYLSSVSLGLDLIRLFLSFVLDRPAYGLLKIMYQLFFNVASADIFANDTVMRFYSRVQLIIGVYMIFQLAMSIIKGIVNPDTFFSADKGAGNLIMRIVTALFLLTTLVPINIPEPKNEFETQINNNGLLFGALYSLQHRILDNNTLGRLILGTNDTANNYTSDAKTSKEKLERSANIFTSTVLKGFYKINVLEEGLDPHEKKNRVCQTESADSTIEIYDEIDVDPQYVIGLVNKNCKGTKSMSFGKKVKRFLWSLIPGVDQDRMVDNKFYLFAYNGFVSAIVGFVFAFILLSFTIDVAVRMVKLGVLRLIAPIPIISYMDPKGGKDGAFNSWVKTLTSTYLDLFMRLAVVYFVIFLIQDMMVNGIIINNGSGLLGVFSYIIIWIGLFIFAKQAPKFFKKVLGLKDEGGKFFSGISDALAVGSIGAGAVSGAISKAASTKTEGHSITNAGKKIVAGLGGALGGGVNAGKTYYGSKDANAKSIMNANRAYASKTYSNAADESTPFGRFKAGAQANLGLKNELQKMDDQMKYYNAANDALSRINKAFDNNGDTGKITFDQAFARRLRETGVSKGKQYQFNDAGDLTDRDGNVILKNGHTYSLKDLNDTIGNVSANSDADMKDAVAEAKKQAQDMRFKQIRAIGGEKRDRERLVEMVNNPNNSEWNENDLIAYDAIHTIYDVGKKYEDDAVFENLRGRDFSDQSVGWGKYKGAAAGAGRKAEQVKNSDEYAQAKANAQRAEDKNKK